jgi:nitroreductase
VADVAEQLWSEITVPKSETSVYEALHGRRSVWKFEDKPIPHDAVERMLATSVWAPNHKHTEPWRFFVSTKGSDHRKALAKWANDAWVLRDSTATLMASRQEEWVLEQPLMILAYAVPGIDEAMTRENYASVVCALHNVGLAGVAEGLAVTWETGGVAKLAGLAEAVGGDNDWQLVAVATVGWPDEESPSSRTPVSEFVTWD